MFSKVHQLNSLPSNELAPSILVDLLHFIACDKLAVRFHLDDSDTQTQIINWCHIHEYSVSSDTERYICITHNLELAENILHIDADPMPHAQKLGLLLGYPECCSQFIHKLGECNIDWVAELIGGWKFDRRFNLINPSGYLEGKSLICHLPCSPVCESSLEIAEKALHFIKSHYNEIYWLNQWEDWVNVY